MNLLPKFAAMSLVGLFLVPFFECESQAQQTEYQQLSQAMQQYAYQQQLAQIQYQQQQYAYELALYQQMYMQMLQAQQNASYQQYYYYPQTQYAYPVSNQGIYSTQNGGWADNRGGYGTRYSSGQFDNSGGGNHVISSFGKVLNLPPY